MTVAKTNLAPQDQVRVVSTYTDTIAAGSTTLEPTVASGASIEDNIHGVISQINRILNATTTGNNWFVDINVPPSFEGGAKRGVRDLNTDLHDLERKRMLKRVSVIGKDIPVSTAAGGAGIKGTLTSTGVQVSNNDTVTIDVKTYTFQTTLTNVDGNVLIGSDAEDSLLNLQSAINLTGTPGTDYALATTLHPTVYGNKNTATTLEGTAKTQGTAGNSIVTTKSAVTLSWGAGTLSGGGSTTDVIVLAPLQLPSSTTAAIGAVTTLGLVVATASSFGSGGLDEVTGANALQPKNEWILIDESTGEPLTRTGGVADGAQVFGLGQCESAVDGSTIDSFSPNGLQVSLVVRNSTGDDLELITAGDVPTSVQIDYAYVNRDAFEDVPEEAWLGEGFVDSGVSTATRQASYDNQGSGVVLTTTNATLDLGTGFTWEIGDDGSDSLFKITEGSPGANDITIGAEVDTYVNSAVDVDFTQGITANTADAINIGKTTDQIDFTGNAKVTGGSSTMTLTTDSNSVTVSTTTSGTIDVQGVGSVTVDSSGGGIGIGTDDDSGGINIGTNTTARTVQIANSAAAHNVEIGSLTGAGTLSLRGGTNNISMSTTGAWGVDADENSQIQLDTASFQIQTVTSGEIDLTAAGLLDLNAGANMDVDVTGSIAIDATSSGSVDFVSAGNLTVTSGDLLVSTATAGHLLATSANSILGTIGASDSDHHRWAARHHYFGAAGSNPNYATLNAQNSSTNIRGGIVVVNSANTFTPGDTVSATSATTFTVDAGAPVLAADDYFICIGSNNESVNGLYQALTVVDGTITINTSPDEEFLKAAVEADGSATGTLYKADVSVMRANAAGNWEVADGDSGSLSYVELGTTAGSTLQAAYAAGSDIVVSSGNTSLNFTGTINDATDVLVLAAGNHSSPTAGNVLAISNDASSSGSMVALTGVGVGNALNVTQSGSGDAVFVNNTGSGAITFQDGGGDVFDIASTGAVTITPTSGTNFDLDTAGAGIIDMDSAATVALTGATGSTFETDGNSSGADLSATLQSTNSNATAASGAITNVLATADGGGTAAIEATVNVEATSDSTTGVNIVNVQATDTGTLNMASGAFANIVNLATGNALKSVNVLTGTTAGQFAAFKNAAHTVALGDSSTGVFAIQTGSTFNVNAGGGSTAKGGVHGWIIQTNNLDKDANTKNGILSLNSSNMNYGNGASEGDIYDVYGGGDEGYTSTSGTTAGSVYVKALESGAVSASVAFVAGVSAASNATIEVTNAEGSKFATNDIISVVGAEDEENDGLYEVLSVASDVLTVRGMLTASVEDFTQAQVTTNADDTSATVGVAQITVFRNNTSGALEFQENFSATGGTWTTLASGVTSLQEAYVTGNTITTSGGEGDVTIQGTEDLIVGGSVTVSFDTTDAILLEADAASTFNVTGANVTLSTNTSGDVNVASAGDVLNTTATGSVTGGEFDVTCGNGTTKGGTIDLNAGPGATNGGGGDVLVNAGAGVGTGNGGALDFDAGPSGSGATGNGGNVSAHAGDAVSTDGAGGGWAASGGDGTGTGAAGTVQISGGAADDSGDGGSVTFVPGASSAGTDGVVGVDSGLGLSSAVFRLDRADGTSGVSINLFTGSVTPEGGCTANMGDIYFRDDDGNNAIWVKETGDATNTGWEKVATTSSQVSRNFFQDTIDTEVAPSTSLQPADFTGNVIATKPSADFSFDTDAQVFLNGVHLMNGSGNEVTSGAGNDIDVEASGPTFRVGDVVTIVYHTNSTNNTTA